ncbi:MAG: hypothetical protein HLX50_02620 [Alteromonadaceae bacterium]|nr:hypothetical protein [Alteromonadaceae bacterium]
MKAQQITLPAIRPAGCVEAYGAPLAYLAWLAWPGDEQKADRDSCFLGGMASAAKAAKVPRPEFPDSAKGRKPQRVDNKLNHAFDIILRRRWRAFSMLTWRLNEGLTQEQAAERLLNWSVENTSRQGDDATRGIFVARDADENLSSIRARVWRDSATTLPMTYGFFHALLSLHGTIPKKTEILNNPDWLPIAVTMAGEIADTLADIQPNTRFIIPCLA